LEVFVWRYEKGSIIPTTNRFNGDARPFDNRFPDHNIRVRRNPVFVGVLFVCHSFSLLRKL
jgi:hypothetical protein